MDIDEEKAAARKVGEYGGYVCESWFTELDGRSVYELRRPGPRPHYAGIPFLVSVGEDGVGYELSQPEFYRAMASHSRQRDEWQQFAVNEQPVHTENV